MANKSDKSDPATQMSDLMSKWQEMGAGAMNTFGAGWFDNMNEMGTEWVQFLTDRIDKDVKLQQDLLQATTPAEVQRIQTEFFRKAADDYTEQTGKMVKLGSKFFE